MHESTKAQNHDVSSPTFRRKFLSASSGQEAERIKSDAHIGKENIGTAVFARTNKSKGKQSKHLLAFPRAVFRGHMNVGLIQP
jgi:hypothetical protein